MSSPLKKSILWVIKANLIMWIINGVLFAITLYGQFAVSFYFSKITLIETGVFFLYGGALAFSGSILPNKAREHLLKSDEKWSIDKLRNSEKRANKYIVLAGILLIESVIIGLLGA